jgi:uncharacterized protein
MASIITRRLFLMMLGSALMLWISGCSKPAIVDGVMPVEIGGRTFNLEIVADDATRNLGLGGRKSLDDDKGMLFSFKDAKIRQFVMRDCYIDIDIIFLDSAGRIIAMHHMPIEEPKKANESQAVYENRLKRYSSRFNAKYAIELVGGMLENLDLEDGQHINLDTAYLESITQ